MDKALTFYQETLWTGQQALYLSGYHLFFINQNIPKGETTFSDSASKTEQSSGHQRRRKGKEKEEEEEEKGLLLGVRETNLWASGFRTLENCLLQLNFTNQSLVVF